MKEPKASYRSVKLRPGSTAIRYKAVVRYPNGNTVTIGRTKHYSIEDALAAAQTDIDRRKELYG